MYFHPWIWFCGPPRVSAQLFVDSLYWQQRLWEFRSQLSLIHCVSKAISLKPSESRTLSIHVSQYGLLEKLCEKTAASFPTVVKVPFFALCTCTYYEKRHFSLIVHVSFVQSKLSIFIYNCKTHTIHIVYWCRKFFIKTICWVRMLNIWVVLKVKNNENVSQAV